MSVNETKTFPISEIFGPTIQGEGAMIGTQTLFVRFSGCDYRCSWCDTKYASYAEEIKTEREEGRVTRMTHREIIDECIRLSLKSLPGLWVTFSGGNPALFNTYRLTRGLQAAGFKVAMETQGSRSLYSGSLHAVDHLIVSPKPPSSGQATNYKELRQVINAGRDVSIKVVIFDKVDLQYAAHIRHLYPEYDLYLSAGTPQDEMYLCSQAEMENAILRRTAWLAEEVCGPYHSSFPGVKVLPQLHALLWGAERKR
jgi:7-carboxy-7-deazaguanine synthase